MRRAGGSPAVRSGCRSWSSGHLRQTSHYSASGPGLRAMASGDDDNGRSWKSPLASRLRRPQPLRRDPGQPRRQGLQGPHRRARPRRSPAPSPARTWWSSRARAPGKTAAFGIPIVEKIDPAQRRRPGRGPGPHPRARHPGGRGDRPSIGRGKGVKVESIYGGDSMDRQLEGIRAGAHVIVGTPGPRPRPPAPADPALRRGEAAGARRGRPHARHGLRGRDGPDHGVHARASGRRLLFSATVPAGDPRASSTTT